MSQWVDLPQEGGGGGGGAVDDVNGVTGSVNIVAGSGISVTTFGQNVTVTNTGTPTGSNNTFAGFNGSGVLFSVPGFTIDTVSGGINEALTQSPNNVSGGFSANSLNVNFTPLQNSPNDTWNINYVAASFDTANSGFSQGTNGEALTLNNFYVSHQGTGDVGGLSLVKNSFNIGNGTDPIDVKGIAYSYGFGDVNSGVTVSGAIQGYGFQPHVHPGAIIDTNQNVTAFYDFANIEVPVYGYTSFAASPNIAEVSANININGIGLNPTIPVFDTGASFTGVAIGGSYGTLTTTGNWQGINVSPTIADNGNYAAGLFINMGNVTNATGAQSSLVVQDITYTFNQFGDNNSYQMEYTNTVIAGNEVATILGNLITVQIESGVSTATQVAAAIAANISAAGALTTVITGVASNPQVSVAATNFVGGVNPGRKLAIDVVGDVNIQGSLAFTGGLSLGAINSFAAQDISGFPPGVNSIDTLITQPSVPAATTLNTDLLAINTAMLLNIGAGSTLTSSFLGYTALGLPAVVQLGAGSTVDRVGGAAFAISLDSGAGAGGVIDEVDLCRSIAIPNGITTVNKLIGYRFDLPFGDPGTTTWGLYSTPTTAHNFMAGDLVIGDVDVPTNSSVGLELNSTTKAILSSRMTTAEKNALTAIGGMVVFDTTLNQLSYYNGTTWVNI